MRAWLLSLALMALASTAEAQITAPVSLRGHVQTVHLYGTRGGPVAIVSSGDGGWIHLGPHVAQVLAAHGWFVVGFDTKAYLESFTTSASTLRPEDEPGDFKALADFAAQGSRQRPVLVGVSEGAGLSVLAATDPATKSVIGGVLGLGLPDLNELGWRWKDSLIYVTHGMPKEPTFSTAAVAARVAPVPLAAIHSTHDEYVPATEVQRVLASAGEPKRLWMVDAADHRFSDSLPAFDARLLEALAWMTVRPQATTR